MIRLAVRVASAQAELVLAELLELAPAGVEEVDHPSDGSAEGIVEYALYGAPGELPALPDLRAAAGGALVDVSTTEIPDDWHERWRAFHRPVLIEAPRKPVSDEPSVSSPCARSLRVPSLRVRPPWEAADDAQPDAVREIVIDPGQAFGTGGHATTRLCLELLLELTAQEGPNHPVVDIGTGSGVLAIAASRLGFAPVLALDNDPESVAAARANAAVNRAQIVVRRYDLRAQPQARQAMGETDPLTAPAATVVLANLLRPLLLDLAARMSEPPAHLLAGGLLREEVDEVSRAFAERHALRERERRASGEWAALWLSRA